MTQMIWRPGLAGSALVLIFAVFFAASVHAENPTINDLKGKIFDAKMTEQTFAAGLRHCNELDGTNFYFQPRDRVLNLIEYHRSLDNLAMQGVFNPETKRPWTQEDANARWEMVRKQALTDQANCALVASLPALQKKLDELLREAAAPANK
jgi:hypothetical protein